MEIVVNEGMRSLTRIFTAGRVISRQLLNGLRVVHELLMHHAFPLPPHFHAETPRNANEDDW
jgi:hypothetical protein